MERILDHGFTWTVIPAFAMVLFPELPSLAQRALNAEHMTFSMASELQVMAGMAVHAEVEEGHCDWSTVVAKAKASQPPCVAYLAVLAQSVEDFSGGRLCAHHRLPGQLGQAVWIEQKTRRAIHQVSC